MLQLHSYASLSMGCYTGEIWRITIHVKMETNSREEHCLTGYNYSAFAVPRGGKNYLCCLHIKVGLSHYFSIKYKDLDFFRDYKEDFLNNQSKHDSILIEV